MITAVLIATGQPDTNRTHQGYKFDTLNECQVFVKDNYEDLYIGLLSALAREGSAYLIKSINCGEFKNTEFKGVSAGLLIQVLDIPIICDILLL